MNAHTPGPWSVGGKYTNKTVLLNAAGESIASGGNNRAVTGEVLEASLILASAAPELLAACRLAACALALAAEQDESFIEEYEVVSAAIAKATGSAA